jgi:hypothetical protein
VNRIQLESNQSNIELGRASSHPSRGVSALCPEADRLPLNEQLVGRLTDGQFKTGSHK